jgi:murein DD-endopeptidase MepM/ murein hydrolase activator NlpD
VNIIIVSNNMAKPRVLSLRQLLMCAALLLSLPLAMIWMFILPHGDAGRHDVKKLLPSSLNFSLSHPQEHIDALALQLGELQARITKLDALSERLAQLAGVKEPESEPEPIIKLPARGGPQIDAKPLSEADLRGQIEELTLQLEERSGRLSYLESVLLQKNLQQNTMPNGKPVTAAYRSSSYGWRVDPFSGRKAFHEGLDFTADKGTPIYAAAGGIVTTAERTTDYGKLVKIDHGGGIETRYAHASQLLVKVGERVRKGQVIAHVGSTGRSTGPHLHFEVRLNGTPLDPRKYLQNRPS